ncbi:tubulin polyglutamylase TTLL4 isoform X5 [Manduca sexta]|uniref:tubulin polyglutamylase TTLL4 isoform X5 n=1 Tax=Manduca sexta TaxID=7130 RepID=UPI00188FF67C|nr:tubulin polyglutamylase TTLL4 isoform X5 [Manduca sexta]
MWTFDDGFRVGSDMDSRRACPNYEVGFDVCDPLGSVVEWSGARGPARILRRRCRSEGVDRSPYEDASREHRSADGVSRHRHANKSHFTLSAEEAHYDRFRHECLLPTSAAENGDYLMAHDQDRYHGRYSPGRSKLYRSSPTRPLLVTTLSNTKVDDRLPKVEELFEKVDHDMMEPMGKQPLKSILNNPLPKSPPQGILKKPKNRSYQDSRTSLEGRRRTRASSESDNLYCGFQIGSPIPSYESRLNYVPGNMKRAKDNSGSYSYGSALATLGPKTSSNYSRASRCMCKDQVLVTDSHMHVLRTTAINSDTVDSVDDMPRQDTPTPTCPVVSPALPVSSVTAIPVLKKSVKAVKKKSKAKVKVAKMKSSNKIECSVVEGEADDAHSRSPSPDTLDSEWRMDTEPMTLDIEKQEKPPPAPALEAVDYNCVSKLSTKLNGTVVTPKKLNSKESPLSLPESVSSCLRASLFPRVPPYLKFVAHDEAMPLKIPLPIQKHLKWKLTTITPIVVKKTLTNSGFRLVKSDCDTAECPQEETVEWIGIWGKHMKSIMFRAIKDGQKMNHFPGTFQIGRKDRLWRNLQKLASKYGVSEFGIMPKTYVLPHDLKLLKHDWEKYAANNEKWIIKPPASARGTGIKVVSRWTQIPKKRPVVVQRYVSKPYLINGNKFDMRLYVLVTSVHPLRIYLYKDGLARFASVKYNDELTSLNDRYMHLTNYSINRLSKNYTPNEDFTACEGHKWTLQTLFHYLKTEKNVNTDALWNAMKDLVIKTIISGEASISALTKANITSRYNCYELFGIDVLLDEDLKPWLLEVNISPSLHSASPLDIHVKGPLVTTVLNIAQFQVPVRTNLEMLSKDKPHKLAGLPYDSRLYTVYLSKEERDKHIIYTNMEDREMYLRDILSTLTPDDVRHLIQAEDELTQTGDMERVFPTNHTHKYLAYLAGPRYYNRLFDAWETRYGNNRNLGIDLLRNLCDIGYHLETPPVPLKRAAAQLSALDRSRMTWTRRRRPPRSGPPRRPCGRAVSAGLAAGAGLAAARAPCPPRTRRPPAARRTRVCAGMRTRCLPAPSPPSPPSPPRSSPAPSATRAACESSSSPATPTQPHTHATIMYTITPNSK